MNPLQEWDLCTEVGCDEESVGICEECGERFCDIHFMDHKCFEDDEEEQYEPD